MRILWLSLFLVLAPLPGLPKLPNGSELRVVSANLRTIYRVWEVKDGQLVYLAPPLKLPEGRVVRLLVRVDRNLRIFDGITSSGRILLSPNPGGTKQVNLRQVITEAYGLKWPGRENEGQANPGN